MRSNSPHYCKNQLQKGFTLIELMVTLSIVAILSMIAVPSFLTYLRNAEVGDFVNQFTEPLETARRKNNSSSTSYAIAIPNGSAEDWKDGWIIFVDKNSNFALDADDEVVSTQGPLPSYIDVRGIGTAGDADTIVHLSFTPQDNPVNTAGGFGAVTLEFSRNDPPTAESVRRIKVANTGRLRVCRPPTDSTCTFAQTP